MSLSLQFDPGEEGRERAFHKPKSVSFPELPAETHPLKTHQVGGVEVRNFSAWHPLERKKGLTEARESGAHVSLSPEQEAEGQKQAQDLEVPWSLS